MISIEPFAERHVHDAAQLFIRNYRRERDHSVDLPTKYTELETISRLLDDIWKGHPGIVAISNGRLSGYLLGFTGIREFKGISLGVYVPEWGHSAVLGSGREEVIQSLYTAMAEQWIAMECYTHAISFFAADEQLQDVLCWNGFGLLVVDALRPIDPPEFTPQTAEDSKIVIRSARASDLPELVRLDRELTTYLSGAPTGLYSAQVGPSQPMEAYLDDDKISVVAGRGDRLLAFIRGTTEKLDGCTVVRDVGIMGIDFAYTAPSARNLGLGSKILVEILRWGRARQKGACAVDFESANALGRAFWFRYFKPVCLSAIRHIDPRIGTM